MNSWQSRVVALVLLMGVAIVACSAKTEPAGGLQLIVATDLLAPTDFDTVRLEVRQEVSHGQGSSPLVANDFRVPGETTLAWLAAWTSPMPFRDRPFGASKVVSAARQGRTRRGRGGARGVSRLPWAIAPFCAQATSECLPGRTS